MENLSMLYRRNSGLPVALTLGALAALVFAMTWSGCGQVECGKGTVEVDGVCQQANVLECAAGFMPSGDKCLPEDEWVKLYCGMNAAYDEQTGTCIGIGGGVVGKNTCTAKCGAVSGSKICLQGQVFHASALMAHWAGVKPLDEIQADSIITTEKDGATVKIYDPIDFVTNPSGSKPLAEANIEDNGCFVTEAISIPFSNLFAVGVSDKDGIATPTWAFAAMGETPTVGTNSENLLTPAVTLDLAGKWGNNFLSDGTMVAVFRDKITSKGRDGVVPLFDGNAPVPLDPAEGSWKFPTSDKMTVYYGAADPTDPATIVDKAEDKTTASGVVFIHQAEVKAMTGQKSGCTIESGLGGSSPDTLFFRIYDVEGC